MKAWLLRWVAGTPPASGRATPSPSSLPAERPIPLLPAATTVHAARLVDGQATAERDFAGWLLGVPVLPAAAPGERETQALRRLDRLLASAVQSGRPALFPRSAAVVPKLLALMRNESSSLTELSQLVSRDLGLVAEVVRLANGGHFRREEPVVELRHAIGVLGSQGLRRAIARAVVKPLIDGGAGRTPAARRLWEHTDKKAQLSAALASSMQFDPFDAYLLALAHNAAWSSVLRVLDGVEGPKPWQLDTHFAAALALRRDRLFSCIADSWHMTGDAQAMAHSVGEQGLHADSAPLIAVLYTADRLATLQCARSAEQAALEAAPWLEGVSDKARDCFSSLLYAEAEAAPA